mgnify:CR=1 FL=1
MDSNNQIIIYQTEDGQTQVDVRMEKDMIWLTRQQIAVLFGRDYKTISKHINNALKEELADSVVVAKFATTTQHGAISGKTQVAISNIYNLDAIISVGYRVNSKKATQFRKWATKTLKQYIVNGAAINKRRIKELPNEKLSALEETIGVVRRLVANHTLNADEISDIMKKVESSVMKNYQAEIV